MIFMFFLVVFILIAVSRNLLLSLIILEILGFMVVYYVSLTFVTQAPSDYLVLVLFSILVMEGVIGLCGLIMLVSYSGSDYFSPSTFLKI